MTSNLPANLVTSTFKPELLNRLDQIITFHALKPEDMAKIVELELARSLTHVESQGINIKIDDAAKAYFAKAGYDATYGARPLKRLIQTELLDQLALVMLQPHFDPKNPLTATLKSGKIVVN